MATKAASSYLSAILGIVAFAAASPADAQNQPLVKVNLGFATYVPYTAPFLIAEKKGYFKDAGIAVDLHNGTASAGAVQAVAAGNDDLAWVDLATAATAASQGNPVISVANLQPKGELGLISLKSLNIKTPKDIIGKRVGSNPAGSDPVLLKIFLNANKINASDIKVENVPGNSRLPLLLAKQIDLVSGQGFHYETLLTEQKQESNVILYGDYGANLIGHGMVANSTTLASKGPAIKAFLTGLKRGLEDTQKDVKAACQVFLDTKVIGFTLEMCVQELDGWFPLLTMPETKGKPFGYNSDEIWAGTMEKLETYGDVKHQDRSKYYTNAYLPN
jgi:NitT/TauT family transport system substrate-binding protein